MDFVKDFCYYFGVIAFTLFYVAVDSKACGKCVFFVLFCLCVRIKFTLMDSKKQALATHFVIVFAAC